jgi:hypothetical protein
MSEGSAARRLLERHQVLALLNCSEDDLDWLVRTGQLGEIRFRGNVRYDSEDVNQFIATYRRIQERREHADENRQRMDK